MNESELGKVFNVILSSPGMGEMVKLDAKMPRKAILLLHQVVERGLSAKENDSGFNLIKAVGEEGAKLLRELTKDCIDKAGLSEMSASITALQK